MNDNKHIQNFGLFKEKLNISHVIESIFDRLRNKDTFIFKGMGETYGLFSGKKWVYVYENPKNGKLKTSVRKIDKYHTCSNPVLTTKIK